MREDLVIKVNDALNIGRKLELHLKDFQEIYVGTDNLSDSNKFLNSLWREFNNKIGCVNEMGTLKCPWAYFPMKLNCKNSKFSYFGSMKTKIGFIHVGVSYKGKGKIDNIYFLLRDSKDNIDYSGQIKGIVKQARKNMQLEYSYVVDYKLTGEYMNINNLLLSNYIGENYWIASNDECHIIFKIIGQDIFHARKLSEEKMSYIANFLAVETNVAIKYLFQDIKLEEEEFIQNIDREIYQEDVKNQYYEDNKFIDLYPHYKEKVLLSKEGKKFIDILLQRNLNDRINIFLSSCYHFYEGLIQEFRLGTSCLAAVGDMIYMVNGNKDYMERKSVLDISLTMYLSALETVTLEERKIKNFEKCEKCGQTKYEIRKSVGEFIDEYLWEGFGKVFKKIYDLRSAYLHQGMSATKTSKGVIRPALDDKTASGCMDINTISYNVEDGSGAVEISNLREWTSYSLRNYYKEKIIG